MLDEVLIAVQPLLPSDVEKVEPIGGGDFAMAYRLNLANGRALFLKTHANPPKNFFATEAAGLGWLHESATVNVPTVIAVSDSPPYLLMEWIEIGNGSASSEVALGKELAKLHKTTQSHFGRPDGQTTGSLAVPNTHCDSWVEFYAQRRLLPLANIAADRSSLSDPVIRKIELVAAGLAHYGVPEEPPSLLHGDLWAGNRVVDIDGRSWLIDPAAHYGHREFDLSMMRLFGGYGEKCFASYNECYPLNPGWEERVRLHQLAPLIVHAIKFGGHYKSETESALDQYL